MKYSNNVGDFIEEYCPKCERLTTHEYLGDTDDIFDYAIQCKNCETVWEAEGENEIIVINLGDKEFGMIKRKES